MSVEKVERLAESLTTLSKREIVRSIRSRSNIFKRDQTMNKKEREYSEHNEYLNIREYSLTTDEDGNSINEKDFQSVSDYKKAKKLLWIKWFITKEYLLRNRRMDLGFEELRKHIKNIKIINGRVYLEIYDHSVSLDNAEKLENGQLFKMFGGSIVLQGVEDDYTIDIIRDDIQTIVVKNGRLFEHYQGGDEIYPDEIIHNTKSARK